MVLSALLAGLLTSLVVADQLGSTQRIAEEAEPAILNARQIQTSLAEANAAAASSFLVGGIEDPVQRDTYEMSLRSAGLALEEATRLMGESGNDGAPTDDAQDGISATLSSNIATYAGLIETARANNRQGYPVSAAYLGSASELLEEEIYPQTDRIANGAAEQYRDSYDRQRGLALGLGIIAVVLVVVVVLMLVYVQFQLRRRFNRTLNLPLLAATLLAVGLGLWMTTAMANQLGHLTDARDDGYDGTRLYLDLRGTGFGAKADQARFLIARGAGQGFDDDFEQRSAIIGDLRDDFDLHAAESATPRAAELVSEAYEAWASFDRVHEQIVAADTGGDREAAVALALADAEDGFERFDQATAEALAANNERFETEMVAAERAMRWLRFGSVAVTVLVAGLAAYGIQLRINEYHR